MFLYLATPWSFSSRGNTLGKPRSCSPPLLTLPLGPLQLLLLPASLPFLWARGTVVSGKQWPNQGHFLENPARRKTTAKWNCPDALMRSSRVSLECDRGTLPPSAMGETVSIATTGITAPLFSLVGERCQALCVGDPLEPS